MASFHYLQEKDILSLLNIRNGEQKLGQHLQFATSFNVAESLAESTAPFVLLGLPEDIGVRANGGIGGTQTAWTSFLSSFLNIQETSCLSGNDFLLLGFADFSDWLQHCKDAGQEELRTYTAKIDDFVYPVIQQIRKEGKIPIVIGGGHNNAYPLLKGMSLAITAPLHAINLDPHADYRAMEGRHSGNGFRYAREQGYMKKYAMLGLHEAYNSQPIIYELKKHPDLLPLFWEDIFLREKTTWAKALDQALQHVNHHAFGVELDLDSIEHVLSSAATPLGIRPEVAAHYLYRCGRQPQAAYLHLPEGVTRRADDLTATGTGKLLSYLVQAFCKGVLEQ